MQVEVDTPNNEDHTFNGVMFTIECKTELPVDFVQITGISVRGALGPLTVWVTADSWEDKFEEEKLWTKVYERVHPASHQDFVQLTLNEPVLVPKNCSVGMYVHSKLPGDEALVYDNQRSRFTHCKLATHTIEKLSLLLEDSPRLANC